MWRRLHDSYPQPESEEKPGAAAPVAAKVPSPEDSKASTSSSSSKVTVAEGSGSSPRTSGDDSTIVVQRAMGDAAKALAALMPSMSPPSPSSRIPLSIAEDKEWPSDMGCFIRKQLVVSCANEDDVQMAQTDRKCPVSLAQSAPVTAPQPAPVKVTPNALYSVDDCCSAVGLGPLASASAEPQSTSNTTQHASTRVAAKSPLNQELRSSSLEEPPFDEMAALMPSTAPPSPSSPIPLAIAVVLLLLTVMAFSLARMTQSSCGRCQRETADAPSWQLMC